MKEQEEFFKAGMGRILLFLLVCLVSSYDSQAQSTQHSVARQWNEALLEAIREDFARPTVHARNLFHLSIALYDSWAVYDTSSSTYFLGKRVNGFDCPFIGIPFPSASQKKAFQEETMSYAAYNLLSHRFKNSPGADSSLPRFNRLMLKLGYNPNKSTVTYAGGDAAALGNFLANRIIAYGLQDGANESNDYGNLYYSPVNQPLNPKDSGVSLVMNPNRWQPLALDTFVDQSGNPLPGTIPDFLSPEWGNVGPFALADSNSTSYFRDGNEYKVFHDRGAPPFLDTVNIGGLSEEYKWNFALVSKWSAHLDAADQTIWDISPASIGNVQTYPTDIVGLRSFYDEYRGGDPGMGRSLNPKTNLPYAPQMVPRADYARVLAEFWADGPDSETPPGHWFTIVNYVNDHPQLVKKYKGLGSVLDDLEWDVKIYFSLAGAMHDAAITAWSNKGWYDYIRPISAIRYMAEQGQSSDSTLASYHPSGILLDSGWVELVESGDALAGINDENVGKIKLKAWKGPDYINDPKIDSAGVDWILAANWWPYQRPSFVTPPFAGFVSGHSTYSRAAAEVLTSFTGDEFFPGGMGEFFAPKDSFLVFEKGPSVDLNLQWATYRDASDQCSLSRIWGGIHPPADDIPGRLMGIEVAKDAFELADGYFTNQRTSLSEFTLNQAQIEIYPNPIEAGELNISITSVHSGRIMMEWMDAYGKLVKREQFTMNEDSRLINCTTDDLKAGIYYLRLSTKSWSNSRKIVVR